jgi:hypothetical protein
VVRLGNPSRRRHDDGAAAMHPLDEILGFEVLQRFANGRARHVERLCEISFRRQFRAWLEFADGDEPLQILGELDSDFPRTLTGRRWDTRGHGAGSCVLLEVR